MTVDGARAPLRYGYFGPRGTFTEMALRSWHAEHGDPAAQLTPYPTVEATLAAVRSGELEVGVVPIENSVEGGVTATLDALSSGSELWIVGEVLVPITFVLAGPAGITLDAVRAVGTHSHAWAQVRGWMAQHLPAAVYVPTLSTASAAAGVAEAASSGSAFEAAVCAPAAAEAFGLTVLASDIGDNGGAVTRFVVVARPGRPAEPTGADKTSLVLFQHADHAGGLLELLEQFATRGVNLTRLESRPTGAAMGSYCFSIDVEGHVAEARVGEALMGLQRVAAQVRFLGSYAAAQAQPVTVLPGTSDGEFARAQTWLAGLRRGEL